VFIFIISVPARNNAIILLLSLLRSGDVSAVKYRRYNDTNARDPVLGHQIHEKERKSSSFHQLHTILRPITLNSLHFDMKSSQRHQVYHLITVIDQLSQYTQCMNEHTRK
jgi:hypothetical protein